MLVGETAAVVEAVEVAAPAADFVRRAEVVCTTELAFALDSVDVEVGTSVVDVEEEEEEESVLLDALEAELAGAEEALAEAESDVEADPEADPEAEAEADPDAVVVDALAEPEAVEDAPPAVLSPYAGGALGVWPTIEPLPQEIVWPFDTSVSGGGVVAPSALAIVKRPVQYTLFENGDVNW